MTCRRSNSHLARAAEGDKHEARVAFMAAEGDYPLSSLSAAVSGYRAVRPNTESIGRGPRNIAEEGSEQHPPERWLWGREEWIVVDRVAL